MRSCRAQLARHAERRRKRRAEASAAKARARALGVNHAVAAAGGGATGEARGVKGACGMCDEVEEGQLRWVVDVVLSTRQ
jgi:hypothetical protein